MKKRSWTNNDHQTLVDNIPHLPIPDIAKMLGRSEQSVYLYCYRKKIPLRPTIEKNLVKKMFQLHFGSETFFTPNKEFYQKAKISQKHFQRIWMGYKRPSEDELKNIASAINFSHDETYKLLDYMQGELFPC